MSRVVRVSTCSGRGHSIFADSRPDVLFVDTYHNLFTVLFYWFLFVRSAGKLPIFETHVGGYCVWLGEEPGGRFTPNKVKGTNRPYQNHFKLHPTPCRCMKIRKIRIACPTRLWEHLDSSRPSSSPRSVPLPVEEGRWVGKVGGQPVVEQLETTKRVLFDPAAH